MKVKLPYYLLERPELVEDFLFVKQEFSNGMVYRYKPLRMSKELQRRGVTIAPHKLKRLVDEWLRLGWCYMEGETLHFTSNRDKKCISVRRDELRNKIRQLVILSNLTQQQFAARTKRNLKNPDNLGQLKAAKRNKKKLNGDTKRYNSELMLSLETAGELLGVSATTAYRVFESMIEDGMLTKAPSKMFRRKEKNFLTRTPNAYCLL